MDTMAKKRSIIQTAIIAALTLTFILPVTGCLASEPPAFDINSMTTYTDIPGVTRDEINAIEELRKQGASFTVSVPHSIELFTDENGEARGYKTLLCEWLSALFGIRFQPEIKDLPLIVKMLDAGEAGFGSQLITEDRMQRYFMTDPVAQRSISIMRLEGSLPAGVIARSRPPRYVFFEGAMMIGIFADTMEPGSYEEIIAADFETVYRMLQSGEADAFVGNNTMEAAFDIYGGVISEEFLPLTFIPASLATGNQSLEPIVSVINKALRSGAYGHLAELYRQGYQDYKKHKFLIQLTDEEKAYLRDNPVMPFASQYMAYPVSFYNRNEKKWEGIVFDVLKEMEQLTGIVFELVNDTTTELLDLMRLLENGTAYFMPNLIQSNERRERFIWPNTMYLFDRFALLSKQSYRNIELNDIPFERVGFARGSAFADVFRSWFPNAVYAREYPNTDEAFMALDRGEIDLVMSSQSRLAALTNYYEFSDYKANYLFSAVFEASFGVNKEQAIFCSIIDKALPLIDTGRTLEQWQTKTYDYQTKLMKEQQPWFIGVSVLSVCVLALVSVLFARSHSTGRRLEILVRQRTEELELEVNQRKAAEKEARASSEAKSQFLANMSHEIRTPMNSIMGFAELALESNTIPQFRDYLSKITDSTSWLLCIINDILDISKIESGKMELEKVPFSLHEIFSRCQSVILPTAKEKGLDLSVYTEPPTGKKLVGDPVRLYQVLMNLLSNAVKFTDTGVVKFSSAIRDSGNGNMTVYFEVRDTGIGMSSEQIDKVFEPFIQADSSTTRNYGGTGLGLAIVRNIVELMGGKLEVESSPGIGSTFSFEVMFGTIESTGEQSARENFSFIEKPRFDGLILICDDNPMNLEVICEHLSRIGLRTIVAENGKQGLEAVQRRMEKNKKPFDLIFMDIFMPVMDGMEAATKIMELNTGTPIVAMTANVMTSEMTRYREFGMPDCLGKPFTTQELWKCLMKYLPATNFSVADKHSQAADEEEEKALKRFKTSFVKSSQTLYNEIQKAAGEGDVKLAHRLAHTLKGNAGQIGEKRLQEAAGAAEAMLKDGKNLLTDEQMSILETELKSVLEKLAPLLAEADTRNKTETPDEEKVRELFEKIENMLVNINPECMNLLDDIRAAPGTDELVRQIEDFDFGAAVKTISVLKEKMGMK